MLNDKPAKHVAKRLAIVLMFLLPLAALYAIIIADAAQWVRTAVDVAVVAYFAVIIWVRRRTH